MRVKLARRASRGLLFAALLFSGSLPAAPLRHLTIGCDADYPPYEYRNPQGQPAGFNVDLIRELAAEMGVAVEFRTGEFWKVREDFEAGRPVPQPISRMVSARRATASCGASMTMNRATVRGSREKRSSNPSAPES